MKKRIALLLVLVLALTFVLASCGDPKPCETHTDENADGICDVCKVVIPPADLTAFNLYEYDGSEKDPASISKVVTFEFKGEPTNYTTDKLLVTREEDEYSHDRTPNNEDDEAFDYETIYRYRVYSLVTGKMITDFTYRPNKVIFNRYPYYTNYKLSADTAVESFEIRSTDGYFLIDMELYNGKKTVELYDEDGVQLVEVEKFDTANIDVEVDFFGDDHFVFMDVLYRMEADGTKTKVVDTKITNLYNRYDDYNYEFYYVNGKYYAVEYGNIESVTVFDGNFNFVKYVDIPARYDMSADAYILSNGNVFVRYEKEVPVLYLLPTDTYDYVVNGMAFTYDDVIVNTETGEVTDIEDLPFTDISVYPIALETETYGNLAMKADIVDNVITGYEIVDGVIAGETTTYALTNDGAIKNKFVGFDGFDFDDTDAVYAISADAIVFETPAGTYLYKADGTKIGMFPGSFWDSVINDKFIKYGNDIYDFTLTKVFTVENNMKYVTFANDGIYYAKYTEQIDNDPDTEANEYVDGYYTWYVWNGANKELVKIYDDDDETGFMAFNNGYMIMSYTEAVEDDPATAEVNEAVAAKQTVTIYSSAGVKVDEIVMTATTTTADGKTTVVETEIEDASEGDNLTYIVEVITTTVTQGSNTKVTETYKYHAFW